MAATSKLNMKIPKNLFNKAKKEFTDNDFGNANLEPNRRYDAQIVGARIVKVKGEDCVVIDFDIPESNEGKGGKLGQFYYVTDADKLVWLFRDLAKLGYDMSKVESSEEIDTILIELAKDQPSCRISTKQSGEYVNFRIDRLLEDVEVTGTDTAGDEPAPEPEPEPAKVPAKVTARVAAPAPTAAPARRGRPPKAPPATVAEEPAAEAEAEPEPEPAAEEPAPTSDVALVPGLKCKLTLGGKEVSCTVLTVDEKTEIVRVQTVDKKIYPIHYSKLILE